MQRLHGGGCTRALGKGETPRFVVNSNFCKSLVYRLEANAHEADGASAAVGLGAEPDAGKAEAVQRSEGAPVVAEHERLPVGRGDKADFHGTIVDCILEELE